jgi:hypothetical protein
MLNAYMFIKHITYPNSVSVSPCLVTLSIATKLRTNQLFDFNDIWYKRLTFISHPIFMLSNIPVLTVKGCVTM